MLKKSSNVSPDSSLHFKIIIWENQRFGVWLLILVCVYLESHVWKKKSLYSIHSKWVEIEPNHSNLKPCRFEYKIFLLYLKMSPFHANKFFKHVYQLELLRFQKYLYFLPKCLNLSTKITLVTHQIDASLQ